MSAVVLSLLCLGSQDAVPLREEEWGEEWQAADPTPVPGLYVEEVIANEETVKSSQKTAEGVGLRWGSLVCLSELI